jgi:exosome complex component RRP41
MSEFYPRTSIDIFIEVLQSDGGSRCAGITAASLALADAGVPLREIVAACAAGKADGKVVLDLSDTEDKLGEADLPVAFMARSNSVSLIQMDGSFTEDEFNQALDMAIGACKKINELQVEALKRKYVSVKEQVEEKEEPKEASN